MIDPKTLISRDVTDEEVLAYTRGLDDPNDPDGMHLFNKFRTNQLMSKLMRGAVWAPKEPSLILATTCAMR